MSSFLVSRGRAGTRARGDHLASAALMVAFVALARPSRAADSPADLHVTRLAGAGDCADAVTLDAQVSRLVGRDAFDANPAAAAGANARLDVQVTFSHDRSGYVAEVIASDGQTEGRRTIVDESATCAPLGQAVTATLAVMLDGIGAEAPTSARAATAPAAPTSLPPAAPPRSPASAAIDPDDTPPRDSDTQPDPDASEGTATQWYGWQLLLVDLAAIGGLAASVRLGENTPAGALGVLSLVTLVGDGAVIHGAHGRTGAAVGSIALRLGLPLVGGLVAAAMTPRCPSVAGSAETIGQSLESVVCPLVVAARVVDGMGVGLIAASVVDVTLLSWGHVHIRSSSSGAGSSLRIAPIATLVPGPERRMAPVFGIAGSF